MKQGPMPPDEALALLLQAAQALEAIHAAGIVHRDVKPSNFMVTKEGRLKLMDFGIARAEGPRLTTAAAFLGTPAYAAPESLAGTSKPTEAVDLWGLSVTAFEMVTGCMPFAAESVNALLYRVAHEPPQFPEDMAPALRQVFEKALAKEPSQRFASARGFLGALADALPLDEPARGALKAQIESTAISTGIRHRLRRPIRISKGVWVASGLLAAAGLGAWFAFTYTGGTRVVAIYSTPSSAKVSLDGVEVGRTPLPQVVIQGRGGKLRLEKPDYLPLEREIGKDEDFLDLRLTPVPFKVRVAADPAAAQVFLDGQPLGAAPREIQVPSEGRHTLELRADGYEPWTTVLSKRQALPALIHMRKGGSAPPKTGKVRRFFKGLLDQ
jgi:hypothetical protein